ncbi:hypothetical protein HNY73_017922 [Argiope bruennichi]|uniref:Uncharacterized protein n=1 Tax=Argiope bruennichi TaxID=94029 RepID=A0A8T0EBA0_ARGBR|nr:hypothetical protein HNY73_017922 [Argiope bruennichi]
MVRLSVFVHNRVSPRHVASSPLLGGEDGEKGGYILSDPFFFLIKSPILVQRSELSYRVAIGREMPGMDRRCPERRFREMCL